MADQPKTLKVPAHIWRTVEAYFPIAKDTPDDLVVFLLGVACGVVMKQRVDEQARQPER